MTPRTGLDIARPSRRGFLTGGLALGASMTLPVPEHTVGAHMTHPTKPFAGSASRDGPTLPQGPR